MASVRRCGSRRLRCPGPALTASGTATRATSDSTTSASKG